MFLSPDNKFILFDSKEIDIKESKGKGPREAKTTLSSNDLTCIAFTPINPATGKCNMFIGDTAGKVFKYSFPDPKIAIFEKDFHTSAVVCLKILRKAKLLIFISRKFNQN